MFISSPRVTHKDIDISALPRVSDTVVTAALSGSKSESSDSVDKKCDRCTGDHKMKAVICCTDCKKSYCHQHAEVILFTHMQTHVKPGLYYTMIITWFLSVMQPDSLQGNLHSHSVCFVCVCNLVQLRNQRAQCLHHTTQYKF